MDVRISPVQEKIDIEGVSTAVSHREGNGPALVCVHGNSLSRKEFLPLWMDPILKFFPLVTYDLPGHGESDRPVVPEKTYTMAGYAAHLKGLIDVLELDRVVLLGHSLGGHIALEAAGTVMGPELEGLFLMGTPPIAALEDFSRAFRPLPKGASLFKGPLSEEELAVIAETFTGDETRRGPVIQSIRSTDATARSNLIRSLSAGEFHNEQLFLSRTNLPWTLAFGDEDKLLNLDYLRKPSLQDLAGPRLKWIPRGEHLLHWINHGGVLSELRIFMERFNG